MDKNRNQKGISLITLIITIIVLVLISSITLYTGGNMAEQSRTKTAKDRLSTVASAIFAHEKELGFEGMVTGSSSEEEYRLLEAKDYEIMGLQDYSQNEKIPPVFVYKGNPDPTNPHKVVYQLKTPKIRRTNEAYDEEDFVFESYTFTVADYLENQKVEFDTVKGVNRPLLIDKMMPVKMFYDENGDVYSEPVTDIYSQNWYDYSAATANWANVKMNDNLYYVWIPRFAYKIQEFYLGTDYANIPASAISIVFLKENSNYMANDDILPAGYQVHPAFQYKENGTIKNIPGFWVAKYNVKNYVDALYKEGAEETDSSISGALEITTLEHLHPDIDSALLESHLLKNTEWAAVAYLSFATNGKTMDGTSLENNPSAVMELNIKQFVAACLKDSIGATIDTKNFDLYDTDLNLLNSCEAENRRYGDAIKATSSESSTKSAWFGGKSVLLTSENPIMLRGLDQSIFSYDATTRRPLEGAGCRNVLIFK